jgi:hypothetical protein
MGCLDHNLQHTTSDEPTHSPTAAVTVKPKHISGLGCILMTARHNRRRWIHCLCMRCIWNEYEVGEVPQSYHNTCYKWRTKWISYCHCDCETQHIRMKFIPSDHCHHRRCWIVLHMYEVDLIWVWSGWDGPIITYSTIQVRNQVIVLWYCLCDC